MMSAVPVKEKKLRDVKIKELPNWILSEISPPKAQSDHFKEVTTSMTTSMSV